MTNSIHRPPRPRLPGPIFVFAMLGVFGLSCVGIGANWFAAGKPAILAHFPNSLAEAVACTAGGVVLMLWAIDRLLGEIAKQAPPLLAQHDSNCTARPAEKAEHAAGGD